MKIFSGLCLVDPPLHDNLMSGDEHGRFARGDENHTVVWRESGRLESGRLDDGRLDSGGE